MTSAPAQMSFEQSPIEARVLLRDGERTLSVPACFSFARYEMTPISDIGAPPRVSSERRNGSMGVPWARLSKQLKQSIRNLG